jgi:hypothetical protein
VIRELLSDLIPPEDLPKGDKTKWSRRAPFSEKRREGAAEAVASAEVPETHGRPAYQAGWARRHAEAARWIARPGSRGPGSAEPREGRQDRHQPASTAAEGRSGQTFWISTGRRAASRPRGPNCGRRHSRKARRSSERPSERGGRGPRG